MDGEIIYKNGGNGGLLFAGNPLDGINDKNYFFDIVNAGVKLGVIKDGKLSEIENELSSVTAERITAFTRGESSSVRKSVAEKIAKSVVYTLNVSLKNFRDNATALKFICENSLGTVFSRGREVINSKISYAKLLYRKLTKNLFKTDNAFFNGTIFGGIEGFFKVYSPGFFAAETHITADYPVATGRPDEEGIEFICAYLKSIYYENEFLNKFSRGQADKLFGKICPDFACTPVNLFKPVFTSALCAEISGLSFFGLVCDKKKVADFIVLNEKSKAINKLIGISESISENLNLGADFSEYAVSCLPSVYSELSDAVKCGYLDKILLFSDEKLSERVVLSYGVSMGNAEYAELVKSIEQSKSSEEKIALINGGAKSFADLTDVLSEIDLSDKEYSLLFSGLSDEILGALLKFFSAGDISERDNDEKIFKSLRNYLDNISPERKNRVMKIAERVVFEEI